VLNAFRHHGIGHAVGLGKVSNIIECSTPSGIMESVTRQRNCAMENFPYVLNAFRHHGIGHRYACRNCRNTIGVLNAFRHHGIGHGMKGWRGERKECVLNAFRHHGIGHDRGNEKYVWTSGCSTPSGIMESVTSRAVAAPPANTSCSTPSGIMESVTRNSSADAAILGECSTPSGIMESVTARKLWAERELEVLNAFRHHGIGHRA